MGAALDIIAQARAYLDEGRPVDLYARLREQDEQLRARGFPPISAWWLKALRRFYGSGRRQLVLRVGRRGGKSSTLCRVAVCEALHGRHDVTPGDVGVFAFFSVSMKEARGRLRTIMDILDALGVGYERAGDEVRLAHRPVAIRVYAANARTGVGFTSIGAVYDELSRWRDESTGANPATEVLRSTKPAMATMPAAHRFLCSSPFSTLDAHYEAMEQGDTEEQCVDEAPTWEANPTLTEEGCRRDEPDDATFQREYGAVPMPAHASAMFDPRAVEAAQADYPLPRRALPGEHVTAGADFGFRSDSSALVVVHRDDSVWRVADLQELRPGPDGPLRPSSTVAAFAARLQLHQAPAVMCDQHYRESITEHLVEHGLSFLSAPTDVPATYVRLRTLLHQGKIVLPKHRQLARDLREVVSKPTPTGRLSIGLPKRTGGGHCDLVSALVLACWQRGGFVVPGAVQTAEQRREALERAAYRDWTDEELADVDRLARVAREERLGHGSQYDLEHSWLSEA